MENFIKKIKNLEEQLLNPEFRKSKQNLEFIFSDEFIEYGSSGKIFNKKQVINSLLTEEISIYTILNFTAHQLSDNVLLTLYLVSNDKHGQIQKSNRSSIWKMEDKNWKIFFHQGTKCE